jgi:hypothetical protein
MILYPFHKIPLLLPVLRQMNQVQAFQSFLFVFRFDIIFRLRLGLLSSLFSPRMPRARLSITCLSDYLIIFGNE